MLNHLDPDKYFDAVVQGNKDFERFKEIGNDLYKKLLATGSEEKASKLFNQMIEKFPEKDQICFRFIVLDTIEEHPEKSQTEILISTLAAILVHKEREKEA